MSTSTTTPQSLNSEQEDSRDSSSSQFSTTVPKYSYLNQIDAMKKGFSKVNTVTSHGVEDILSEGANYSTQDNSFSECKAEVLPSIPHSFVQDYNSRDSTGFSIHDILGLPQAYNPNSSQEEIEPRYDYQIPNYETISNSPNNNYGSGTEELVSEDCIDKSENLFVNAQISNQVMYSRNYSTNELVQCHQRGGLGADVTKDPGRDIDDLHESSFPSQVKIIQSKLNLNTMILTFILDFKIMSRIW